MSKEVYVVRLKEPMVMSNGDEIPKGVTFSAYRVLTLSGIFFIVPFMDGQLAARRDQVVVVRERS